MLSHGLLAGKFGSFGAIYWNPDGPIGKTFPSDLDEE
jgi:hypothetical protein